MKLGESACKLKSDPKVVRLFNLRANPITIVYRIVLLFLFQILLRIILWFKFDISALTYDDFRGLVGDLAIAIILAASASLLPRRFLMDRFAYLLLVAVLVLTAMANYEVILATGSNIQVEHLAFASQQTMLRGSILNSANTFVIFLVFTFIMIVSLIEFLFLRALDRPKTYASLVTLLIGIVFVWNSSNKNFIVGTPYWRQYNYVIGNLHDLKMRMKPKLKVKSSHASMKVGEPAVHATRPNGLDLTGVPVAPNLVGLTGKRPNILLLLFEGVSGARFPGEIIDKDDFHAFQSFAKLAKMGLRVRNFIALNRQTNRGEYSFICGQYCNITENAAKMDMYDPARDPTCLPKVLANYGYQTIYLQGAWLEFMNKARFMPDAGYEKVYGAEIFKIESFDSGWGANDHSLLEKTKEKILEFNGNPGPPWFMTVMSVGTHHPYGTPKDFYSGFEAGELEHAMAFADHELSQFLDWMKASGQLRNTLVIVSADESSGIGDEAVDRIAQNWLPMYVIGAGVPEGITNDSVFSSADVAASIMDYSLGQESAQGKFSGRSLFRNYPNERDIAYGNCFYQTAGLFEGKQSMVVCDSDYSSCKRFKWQKQMFWPYEESENQSVNVDEIREMADQVQWLPD